MQTGSNKNRLIRLDEDIQPGMKRALFMSGLLDGKTGNRLIVDDRESMDASHLGHGYRAVMLSVLGETERFVLRPRGRGAFHSPVRRWHQSVEAHAAKAQAVAEAKAAAPAIDVTNNKLVFKNASAARLHFGAQRFSDKNGRPLHGAPFIARLGKLNAIVKES